MNLRGRGCLHVLPRGREREQTYWSLCPQCYLLAYRVLICKTLDLLRSREHGDPLVTRRSFWSFS